ncbi:hypothetical protein D3C72_1458920 [compost metagenome]
MLQDHLPSVSGQLLSRKNCRLGQSPGKIDQTRNTPGGDKASRQVVPCRQPRGVAGSLDSDHEGLVRQFSHPGSLSRAPWTLRQGPWRIRTHTHPNRRGAAGANNHPATSSSGVSLSSKTHDPSGTVRVEYTWVTVPTTVPLANTIRIALICGAVAPPWEYFGRRTTHPNRSGHLMSALTGHTKWPARLFCDTASPWAGRRCLSDQI